MSKAFKVAIVAPSYNGLTITSNATGFTIAGGTTSKTLTVNNTIALSGTDGTTITLPATSGTVPLNNQTFYIGTTAVTINRSSATQTLTGVSIDGNAATVTNGVYTNVANSFTTSPQQINAASSQVGLIVKANATTPGDLQQWQNSAGNSLATVSATGAFTAVTKSFDIPHPTKKDMRLRYGSLEGPENGVYVRGKSTEKIIELPEYWFVLVDKDSITVNITPIGKKQNIYVKSIENNKIYLGGKIKEYFFTVYGERKDVDKLTVEY